MKSILKWAVSNSPAMNTFMVALLLVGTGSLLAMRREVFPEFDLEIILVSVPYPGASPAEVEEGICQKVEEAVRSISGIKRLTSVAQEGAGFCVLELESNVPNVQKTLNEVRSEVDRVSSFPEMAEDPEVKQLTLRQPAIRVGVIGPPLETPEAEWQLREMTEKVRNDLLQLKPRPPSSFVGKLAERLRTKPRQSVISQANILGERGYQIDIEVAEDTLRQYGLHLREVAGIVRRQNVELAGGTMRSRSQEMLLRGKSKWMTGDEIADLPLITRPNGVVLRVGDLAVVHDGFKDETAISEVSGRPALVISVDRTANEDLLEITAAVRNYVETTELPSGYELRYWRDASVDVKDRMDLLVRNGLQGLALVFLVLAVFLDLRLAFWVALGIPVAVLGSGAVLLYGGHTLNMLSMFAFLMALGVVVDDAIVIGENIYAHRQQGKEQVRAAVDGAYEVIPSVAASVTTTIIAFAPLLFVAGVMGKFIAVMPVAVIAMLLISLLESIFILPCHLAHEENLFLTFLGIVLYPLKLVASFFHWATRQTNHLLDLVITRFYRPSLYWAIRNPALVVCGAIGLLVFSVGPVRSGITPFLLFPKLDSKWIEAKVTYPDGTPAAVTDAATRRIVDALHDVDAELAPNESMLKVVHRAVGQVTGPGTLGPESRTNGSHVGAVEVELVETGRRSVHSEEILAKWREKAGTFAGADSVTFGTPAFGPGGRPIEFKLLAPIDRMAELETAVEQTKSRLAQYPGVFDIADDSRPGKPELQFAIRDSAKSMGVTEADLAETVRAAFFGEEVMRLQRGRHEVKLMVRYPSGQRRSVADFEEIRVQINDGLQRPLTELAKVNVERGYSEINRVDQLRSITITADIRESVGNAREIVADLQANYMPQLEAEYPFITVRWEGQQEQSAESMRSLFVGFLVAVAAMFVMLTLQFRSYFQPLLIMSVIPFGFVGAVWGHVVMDLPLTLFTMFGLVALTGVVVNDSIVLIDFINHRVHEGQPLALALSDAGERRFRPVLLTSITTIAGLLPLLTEKSFQAQILIPMATSLCFGLMAATALVLYLVPTFYSIYARLAGKAAADVPLRAAEDRLPAETTTSGTAEVV